MSVEMRTPREGGPPAGFRTSVRDVGGRVAEAQFLLRCCYVCAVL